MLLLAVVVLSGCRLDMGAEVVIGADGRGTAAVEFTLDGAMVAELDALEVDPTAELEAAARAAPDWELRRERGDGGSLVLRLTRSVEDASELGEVFGELAAGLAPGDPALWLDLDVATGPEGEAELDGAARLEPPATVGAMIDGTALGPSGEELADLVADAVDARLTATLPGEVVEHNGDALDGRTVTWELAMGEETAVRADAAPAPWWRSLPAWLTPVATGLVVLGLVAVLVRRARRRPAESPVA